MSLEIAPEVEQAVMMRAKQEGVSTNELLARYFGKVAESEVTDTKTLQLIATIRQWQIEDSLANDDELNRRDRERIELETNLNISRQQAGMRVLFTE
jgi:hypothetical protein